MKNRLILAPKTQTKLQLSLKTKIIIGAGILVFIASLLFFLLNNIVFQKKSSAETFTLSAGDYRSATSGNWNSRNTWERYDGTSWLTPTPAQGTPTSSSGIITILNAHTVNINANVVVDQVVVETGGQIIVNNGKTLTIADGIALIDFSVSGDLINNNGIIVTTGGLEFNSSGKYQHGYTTSAGIIPNAIWNTGSTCEITGYTTGGGNGFTPGGLNQNFHNFIWNCPAQSKYSNFNSQLTTINGNFIISQTNGFSICFTNNSNLIINIAGNISISDDNSILDMSMGTGVTTLNISGDFSITDGTITETGTGEGNIFFCGTNIQGFTNNNATISNTLNFCVNSGSKLSMGNNILNGSNGTFTLLDGGELLIGSPEGITATGMTGGNIQVTGTKIYGYDANYTYNGTSSQVSGSGLPATVNNLTINNTGIAGNNTITLTSGISVTGIFSPVSGDLLTEDKTITFEPSSTFAIQESNESKIIGNVSATARLVNTDSLEILGVKIAAGIDNLGYVSINRVTGTYITVNTNSGIACYWEITATSQPANGRDVTFSWSSELDNGLNFSSDLAEIWEQPNEAEWVHSGESDNVSENEIRAISTNVTSFTKYTISSSNQPLPVELLSFKAELIKNTVILSWITISETNNDYFTIERSVDGNNFSPIGTVKGAGNSNFPVKYSFIDEEPNIGINYYILKQTDFDGAYKYSAVQAIQFDKTNNSITNISVYPNPFQKEINISYNSETSGIVKMKFIDINSKKVVYSQIETKKGLNNFIYDNCKDLAAGVYFLEIKFDNNETSFIKVIKST